jgi:ribosomal protein S18 acetylase RimI-like enzyme
LNLSQDAVAADWMVDRVINAFRSLYTALAGASVQGRQSAHLLVCPSVPIPLFNAIWAMEEHPDGAVGDLTSAMADVERQGIRFGVLVRQNRAPALEAKASRLGLTAVERLPAMVVAPNELNDPGHGDLEIVQIRDRDSLDAAIAVAAAGFEAPATLMQPLYQPAVANLSGLAFYLALVDGEPVSTATGWLGDGGVGIFNVATPPKWRGRGFGAAVTAHAVQDGFAAGAALAWLQSSPLGEPVYRRLGFRQVDTHLLLTRPG